MPGVAARPRARLRRQVGHPPGAAGALREAFTPTADEVADARGTLAALDRAAAEGAGAVAAGDRMLDEALAVSARRVLARAGEGA